MSEQSGSQPQKCSRIAGMRAMSPQARADAVKAAAGLEQRFDLAPALPLPRADGMIENVIGTFELPMAVATNFTVNGRDYLVPMAVEEPSVVAAASYMARIVRGCGGFQAEASRPVMRAQIQVLDIADTDAAKAAILDHVDALIEMANSRDRLLVELGGGCIGIELHEFEQTPVGAMLVVHLLVDVRDAMGANTVNTMAEHLAPEIERLAGARGRLRILSNLADKRLVRAWTRVPASALDSGDLKGEQVAQGIIEAAALALVDPYRAATHNKGIMNGIDPVVVATGNDWRAIEAGAHAYAARDGRYGALSRWRLDDEGALCGEIELPMALGLVGGATKTHPAAQAALRLLDVGSSGELAEVVAAVGLAQNMAALRALATEGIQKGHMRLHARNIAIAAGASGAVVDRVAAELAQSGDVSADHARRLLASDMDGT